jgi:hypothetical protein
MFLLWWPGNIGDRRGFHGSHTFLIAVIARLDAKAHPWHDDFVCVLYVDEVKQDWSDHHARCSSAALTSSYMMASYGQIGGIGPNEACLMPLWQRRSSCCWKQRWRTDSRLNDLNCVGHDDPQAWWLNVRKLILIWGVKVRISIATWPCCWLYCCSRSQVGASMQPWCGPGLHQLLDEPSATVNHRYIIGFTNKKPAIHYDIWVSPK